MVYAGSRTPRGGGAGQRRARAPAILGAGKGDGEGVQPPDHQFGKYELLEVLGEGGMARVYRAVRSGPMGFRKEVALKQILPHVAKEEKLVRALINEARLGGYLRHRNIVEVYEFDQVDDVFYIAMEYVAGCTLDRVLARVEHQGPLPPRIVADIAMQMCDGLQYAHTAVDDQGGPMQLVHRDLKPTNVMIQTDGTVKIMDFGIARAETNLFRTTTASVTKGTPVYMSPEQVRGDPLDHRSDLFTLGSVVAEMITGEVAFQGTQLYQVLQKVARADTTSVLEAVRERMPEMVPVLQRCYQPDPDARYQSAAAIREDIEALLPRLPGNERLETWLAAWVAVPLPSRDTGVAPGAADLAAQVRPDPSAGQGTAPRPDAPPATTMSQGSIEAGVPAGSAPPGAWPPANPPPEGASAIAAGGAAPVGAAVAGGPTGAAAPGGATGATAPGTAPGAPPAAYPQPSFPPPSAPSRGGAPPGFTTGGQPPPGQPLTPLPPAGQTSPDTAPPAVPVMMVTGEAPRRGSSALPWIMVGVLLTIVLVGGGAAVLLGLGGLVVLGNGEGQAAATPPPISADTGPEAAGPDGAAEESGRARRGTRGPAGTASASGDASAEARSEVDGDGRAADDAGAARDGAENAGGSEADGAVADAEAAGQVDDARDEGAAEPPADGDAGADEGGDAARATPVHQRRPEEVLPPPGRPTGTKEETADTLPPRMVKALESEDDEKREEAVEDLEDHDGADASAAIERAVKTDPVENVRYEAVRAGKKRRTAADVRICIWALRNDTSPKVRAQACRTLEVIGDPAALRPLCRALLSDTDPAVRKAAAEAIGGLEDPAALDALIYQESHEADEQVLSAIRSAIDDLE